jgi:RimJ/RimL family protein N-acetyltransferase
LSRRSSLVSVLHDAAGAQLSTERVRLAPLRDTDVAALVRHWGEAEVARYLWLREPVTMDMVAEIVTTSDRDFQRAGYGVWALYRAEEAALIGVCGLRQVQGQPWVEILFSLRQRHWGQGLGSEAVFAVLEYAFSVVGLERVVAMSDTSNIALGRLLKRLNMAFLAKEGERTYFDLTAARFRAASKRPPPTTSAG